MYKLFTNKDKLINLMSSFGIQLGLNNKTWGIFMGLITEQYKDSSNFVARIELNRKFRTNPQPLTHWLFDQWIFRKIQGFWNLDVETQSCGGLTWTK
jgi:hypothetical protein